MNNETTTTESNENITCRDMSRVALVHAIRQNIKAAKVQGIIPKEWKLTVSCVDAGYTKSVRVKVSNYRSNPKLDESNLFVHDWEYRRAWERKITQVINEWNYNNSQIEYDHFDVGYYTNVRWM